MAFTQVEHLMTDCANTPPHQHGQYDEYFLATGLQLPSQIQHGQNDNNTIGSE